MIFPLPKNNRIKLIAPAKTSASPKKKASMPFLHIWRSGKMNRQTYLKRFDRRLESKIINRIFLIIVLKVLFKTNFSFQKVTLGIEVSKAPWPGFLLLLGIYLHWMYRQFLSFLEDFFRERDIGLSGVNALFIWTPTLFRSTLIPIEATKAFINNKDFQENFFSSVLLVLHFLVNFHYLSWNDTYQKAKGIHEKKTQTSSLRRNNHFNTEIENNVQFAAQNYIATKQPTDKKYYLNLPLSNLTRLILAPNITNKEYLDRSQNRVSNKFFNNFLFMLVTVCFFDFHYTQENLELIIETGSGGTMGKIILWIIYIHWTLLQFIGFLQDQIRERGLTGGFKYSLLIWAPALARAITLPIELLVAIRKEEKFQESAFGRILFLLNLVFTVYYYNFWETYYEKIKNKEKVVRIKGKTSSLL